MKRRKMDLDDKKKAFAYWVLMWMVFIVIYFILIHEKLGGENAPWVIVDSILFGSCIICLILGVCLAKLQAGKLHCSEGEIKYKRKRFED